MMAGRSHAQPRGRALPAAIVPRGHIRVRGHPEAERSRLPQRGCAHLHRHAARGLRRRDARGPLLHPWLSHAAAAGVRVALLDRDRRPRSGGCPHEAGGGGRAGAQPGPVPHGDLAHHAVLPRRGHRLRIRVASVRPCRAEGQAHGARPAGAPLAGSGLTRGRVLSWRALLVHGLGLAGLVTAAAAAASTLARGTYGRHPGRARLVGVRTPWRTLPAARPTWGGRALARRLPGIHDPRSGEAAIVVRGPNRRLYALSARCTHAGCTLRYSRGGLTCPCHHSTFDIRTGRAAGGRRGSRWRRPGSLSAAAASWRPLRKA